MGKTEKAEEKMKPIRGSFAKSIVAKAVSVAVAKSSCPPPKLEAAPKKILKCRPHSQKIQNLKLEGELLQADQRLRFLPGDQKK